jgi:beta-mannanase
MDESPAFISFYKDWTLPLDVAPLHAISDKGAMPVVTWEPWSAADTNGVNQPAYKLSTITAGNHDAYIRTWAANAKAYNKPIMIRFAHEMNGNWYPWSEQVNGNAPGDYVAAWKHVVDVFETEGATNVQWVWAPNITTGTALAPLYPGTAYVDHTGIDGFNWGAERGAWQQPWDVLDSTMVEIANIAPDKNIIVTEIGTVETEGANTKAAWINDAIWYLNHWNNDLSKSPTVKVTGIIWFDLNKEHDWRINSSTEAAEAMKSALNLRLTT